MRGRMGEADTIRGVWLAALAIFGRYPLAVPGSIGEVPAYLIDGRPLLDQALTLVTAYVAYYVATLVVPLAAFATSLAHSSVASRT
jgi:hypothetical protein